MTDTKVCVVAGVGPGVGAAVARRFAREGFAVALMARRAEALAHIAAGIAAEGGTAHVFPVDLTDLAALDAAFATARERMGSPEVLVYNAGRWVETPAMALAPAALETELRLGAVGRWPPRRRSGPPCATPGGARFCGPEVGSRAPQYGAAAPALTAAKSALRGLAFAAAPELAEAGVRLATITIAGTVVPGGSFDPDRIAEAFWAAHAAPTGSSPVEHVFSGAPS